MKALIIGIVLSLFAVFAAIPSPGLGWWEELLYVLRGLVPVIALFIGVIAVFVGITDLMDSREAKKDAEAEADSKKD